MKSFYYMLPLMAGLAIAVQSGVNSQLRMAIQHPLVAAFISFLVGTIALAVMLAFSKDAVPELNIYGTVSWYKFSGGLLGVFVVYTTLLSVSQIGAANMFMLMIGGQMAAALLMDHFGLLGVPVNPITIRKVAGIAFLIAGVYLIKK
jgi:bacterial/archaeal transporter family-2 protein